MLIAVGTTTAGTTEVIVECAAGIAGAVMVGAVVGFKRGRMIRPVADAFGCGGPPCARSATTLAMTPPISRTDAITARARGTVRDRISSVMTIVLDSLA